MGRFAYRVEETSVELTAVPATLASLLNTAAEDWELLAIDHLRDEGTRAVFLLVWRQAKAFGDLTEPRSDG